jgi:hypothetical protein
MQIEEGFRDMKSSRFGLGFELNFTSKIERLSNLILLTTVTALLLVLIGKVRFQIPKKEWQDGIRQLVQQLEQGAYL